MAAEAQRQGTATLVTRAAPLDGRGLGRAGGCGPSGTLSQEACEGEEAEHAQGREPADRGSASRAAQRVAAEALQREEDGPQSPITRIHLEEKEGHPTSSWRGGGERQ